MADVTPIKFEIDKQALSEQVAAAINQATRSAAFSLRSAANELDPEWALNDERFNERRAQEAYDRGYADGKLAGERNGAGE